MSTQTTCRILPLPSETDLTSTPVDAVHVDYESVCRERSLDVFTLKETSRLLKVSVATVRGLISSGKLRCLKISDKIWRVSHGALADFIASEEYYGRV